MDDGGLSDLDGLDEWRQWCDDARQMLSLHKAERKKAALPPEGAVIPEAGSLPKGPGLSPDELLKAAADLKKAFQSRFNKPPAGAKAADIQRLEQINTQFSNLFTNVPDEARLREAERIMKALVEAMAQIVGQVGRRKALLARLATLAATGKKGMALVDGATDADTLVLEGLRDTAAKTIDAAVSAQEFAAAAVALDGIAQERLAIEVKVEARAKREQALREALEGLKPPPEFADTALDTEREAVTTPLVAPLTDAALLIAEAALPALRAALARMEAEAKALHRMRGVFEAEADELARRVDLLEKSLAARQKNALPDIRKAIKAARDLLAPRAGRPATESFPVALENAKSLVMLLVGSAVSVSNAAGDAAAVFLAEELKALQEQADILPVEMSDETRACAKAAKKQGEEASLKLGRGSAGQASQAKTFIAQLAKTIVAWRTEAKASGIVLSQRRDSIAKTVAPADPVPVSKAFAAALKDIRDKTAARLSEDPTEDNVAEAETLSQPFPALLARAKSDGLAAAEVDKIRLDLAKDLDGVIAKARPAAAAELRKSRVAADQRAALLDMGRDMERTAVQHAALLARMKELAAEPDFAAADKAPFAPIDVGVRELAFKVCGPALVASMDEAGKRALSTALQSDGPAIELLAEKVLAGNAKLLPKLLSDCGAAGVATLARALAGDGQAASRESLEGLVDKSGLGDNPAILALLVGESPKTGDAPEVRQAKLDRQASNATSMKSLADNFSGDTGQEAMSALMKDCALGTSPGALASLLQDDGFAGDGKKLRDFADAFAGDEVARQDLARVVSTAGVAQHPKVLGPLAKKSGAAGVKKIGAAFTAPADCANLKGLLDGGGMGGDTATVGKQHEHPDTLAKVFGDGLKGDGTQLKAYAKAFSGPDGPAKSKEMLDAFNEFGEDHAESRQPGKGIAELLGGKQLQGTTEQRIQKLSTQFVPNIKAIGNTDQRKQAFRMAPFMGTETAQEDWKPESPAMTAAAVKRVTASVLKRHQPEAFDKGKARAQQTMFPPGTDVGAALDEALAKLPRPIDRTQEQETTVTVGDPPIQLDVVLGFLGTDTVNHFGPRNNPGPPHPQETPNFTLSDINNIFAAIK